MADTTKPLPAYYKPGPPEIMPLPLAQTDILLYDHRLPSILSQEELPLEKSSGLVRHRDRRHRTSSPYHKTVTFQKSTRSATPYQEAAHNEQAAIRAPSSAPNDHDDGFASDGSSSSDASSSSSSSNSSGSVQSQLSQGSGTNKIQKPVGEVGRPGRGGYNLQDVLGLQRHAFVDLKDCVNNLIAKHQLNTTNSYAKQSDSKIRKICKDAIAEFPQLGAFNNCWPVRDLLKARLKYTSSGARQLRLSKDVDEDVGKNRAASKGPASNAGKSAKGKRTV